MTRVLMIDNRSQYFLGNRRAVAEALVARGVEVHAATLTERPGDPATIARAGVHYHSVASRLGSPGLIPAVAGLLRQVDADLVHAFTLRAGFITSLASLAAPRRPLFVSITGLGYTFISDAWKARALRSVVRAGMLAAVRHRVTAWVFQNPDDRAVFTTRLGVKPEACHLIRGSGVDLRAIPRTPEPEDETPHVVFVGRLLRDKGIVEFVTAALALRDRGVAARYTVAGDVDPDNPASVTEADVAEWRDAGPVRFVGFVDDVPRLIESANVVCLPSYREGLPKVLLEAGAAGRASVTTDVPGCREVIEDGVNGLLVPARDAEALADAIAKLAEDPGRRRAMGHAARRIVERDFSIDDVIRRLRDVYRDAGGVTL